MLTSPLATPFVFLLVMQTHVLIGTSLMSNRFCNETMECVSNTISSNNVYCDGFHGCTQATITSNQIICDGTYSCYHASLSATSILSCNGLSACFNTTQAISHSNMVSCGGKYGCAFSRELTSTTIGVHCEGYMSCMQSNIIRTGVIVGNGERALNNANIDSQDSVLWFSNKKGMVVNAKGFMSGGGANIYCRDDTECTVLCDGTGCLSMNVYCFYGSECIIDPAECGDNQPLLDHVVTQIDGVKCPNVYFSREFEEDEMISESIAENEPRRVRELHRFLSGNEEYQLENRHRYLSMKRLMNVEINEKRKYYNNVDGIVSVLFLVIILLGVFCGYYTLKLKRDLLLKQSIVYAA
eukprot:201006_1